MTNKSGLALGSAADKRKQWATWASPIPRKSSSYSSVFSSSSLVSSAGKRKRPAPFGLVGNARSKRVTAFASVPQLENALTLSSKEKSTYRKRNLVATTCKSVKKKTPGNTQTFLDFGQRVFDSTRCTLCGMIYAPGVKSDETEHDNFCEAQRQKSSLSLGSVANLPANSDNCVAQMGSDGSRTFVFWDWDAAVANKNLSKLGCRVRDRIIDIKRRDIDPAMGFAQSITKIGSSDNAHSAKSLLVAHTNQNGHLAGICVIERLDLKRNTLLRAKVGDSGSLSFGNGEPSGEEKQILAGVLQIWVGPNSRRTGVAGKLVDVARQHLYYGMVVPRERLAFSQPTEQGANFAAAYCGRPNREIYIYKI